MPNPLFTHEDRDFLHEIAEVFYGKVTDDDKERGDKVWDLAERVQQWIDQEANTTRITPNPGWATVPIPPARDLIVSSAHGKYWNAYGEEVPTPNCPLPMTPRLPVIDETTLLEG